jgi:hypothetical protein
MKNKRHKSKRKIRKHMPITAPLKFSRTKFIALGLVFAIIGCIVLWNAKASTPNVTYGDLNNDNAVTIVDLSILLSDYNTTNARSDINNDGNVNIFDLSILMSHYGGTVPVSPPPPATNPNPIPAPTSGALWGSYISSSTGRTEATTESLIGRKLAIFKRYRHWDHNPLLSSSYKTLANEGRTLSITIKPEVGTDGVVSWASIANGSQDAVIDRFAAEFKTFGLPLFVTFNHEPENDSAWGTDTEFAAAFRHFYQRLEQQGVTNVASVWNMMGAQSHFDRYQALYPGDDVVDWVAWDEYNWAGCDARTPSWWSPARVLDAPVWWDAQTFHGDKPQMEAEYGSHEAPTLGDKGQWFRDLATAAKDQTSVVSRIKAWVYFDADNRSSSGCYWDSQSSASSSAGFRDAGLSSIMNP